MSPLWNDYDARPIDVHRGGNAGIWVINVLVIVALIGVGWYQWQWAQGNEEQKSAEAETKLRSQVDDTILEDVGSGEVVYFKQTGGKSVTIERVDVPSGHLYVTTTKQEGFGTRMNVSTTFEEKDER